MAGTAFANISDIRPGQMVPNAGQNTVVARFSASVLNGTALVRLPDGRLWMDDTSFVAVASSDTLASIQANVLAAIKAAYNDNTITAVWID